MKHVSIAAGLIVLAALLAACATTKVVGAIPQPQSTSADAQITVCRKRVFVGDGVATIISVDGSSVLRSGPGVCFSANLAPGEHTISVLGTSWAGPNTEEENFTAHSGDRLYFVVKNETIEKVQASDINSLISAGYKVVDVQ